MTQPKKTRFEISFMPIVVIFLLSPFIFISALSGETAAFAKNKRRPFPVIVDTVPKPIRTGHPLYANYEILYIGKYKDTITIGSGISVYSKPYEEGATNPLADYTKFMRSSSEYRVWTKSKIDVLVDTNSIVNGGYPVFISNMENDTIQIGYGQVIPIYLQAVDSTGKWSDIERVYIYSCGVGLKSLILPPGEIIITSAPVTQGNYETQLRLTLGTNHSPSFKGRIKYQQFCDDNEF